MLKITTVLTALAVVASWGFNAAIGKIGVMELEPLAFLCLRFFLTAVFFMPFAHARREDYGLLLMIAILLNVCHQGSVFVAFKFLPASSVTVLQQSQVPFAVIIACLFAKERVSFKQVCGIILAILGVLCIFGVPDLNLVGAVFALLSSLFWAIAQLALKRSRHISPYTFMAYTTLFSCPMFAVLSLIFEEGIFARFMAADQSRLWGSMAYEVFAMAAAMMLWQRLVAANGVNKMAPFTLLQVLFGILSGFLFFQEKITPPIIGGAVLTICGVGMTILRADPFRRFKKVKEL